MTKKSSIVATLGLALMTAAAGCGSSGSSAAEQAPSNSNSSGAERAIVEADIIKLDSGRLYALSTAGSLSVIDVSAPGRLAMLGQKRLGGEPFELYRRGDLLVTMLNGAFTADGTPVAPKTDAELTQPSYPEARDPKRGAGVVVIDAKDPTKLVPLVYFPVPGEIADSRIVGDVLYLVTYENAQCWQCAPKQSTMVTTFDLKDPMALRRVDQVIYESPVNNYEQAWGLTAWKRSIFVTPQRMYVGGHSDVDPYELNRAEYREGIIDVLDITDPTGKLVRGAHLEVEGSILSRWQLDERNGVLRVISQRGAGRTSNGVAMPKVETFTVNSTQSIVPLGLTTLSLPRQEGLRTVRFDDKRAYAITYNQTDPLFTIDLQNPAAPRVRGELHMPGFMFYLEPYGDRLIGLGVDNRDPDGSLNVSLFNVENLDDPRMISRVPFASPSVGSNQTIVNYELPEDQDRVQKAFRVFADGIVAMPFTYAYQTYYDSRSGGNVCDTVEGAVELIDWKNDSLTHRSRLPVRGTPRRALQANGEMLAVSDSNVTSYTLTPISAPRQTADLEIGPCASPYGRGNYDDWGFEDGHYGFFGCSTATARTASPGGLWMFGLFGLLGLLASARSARRRAK